MAMNAPKLPAFSTTSRKAASHSDVVELAKKSQLMMSRFLMWKPNAILKFSAERSSLWPRRRARKISSAPIAKS